MDAAKVDKAEVFESMAPVPDDQAAKVPQPGEEPLHLPAPQVAPQRTAILGLGPLTSPVMSDDHLDAQLCLCGIQRIGIIGTVLNEAARQRFYEAGVERGGDKINFVRRSRRGIGTVVANYLENEQCSSQEDEGGAGPNTSL